jgi:hypothetical protein
MLDVSSAEPQKAAHINRYLHLLALAAFTASVVTDARECCPRHATRFGDSKPAMKRLHFSSIFSGVREVWTGISG